jgi:hypothetical protein
MVLPPLTLTDTKPFDSFRHNGENYKFGTYYKSYNIILPASTLLFSVAIIGLWRFYCKFPQSKQLTLKILYVKKQTGIFSVV